MSNNTLITSALAGIALAAGALIPAAGASAAPVHDALPGFDAHVTSIGSPLVDPPTFPGDCDHKPSPSYGWCHADITVEFQWIGGADIPLLVRNTGTATSETVWVTITINDGVLDGELVRSSLKGDVPYAVHQSKFDSNVYFMEIHEGIPASDGVYLFLPLDTTEAIDVTVEANFHADMERQILQPDYRVTERTYKNNTATFSILGDI